MLSPIFKIDRLNALSITIETDRLLISSVTKNNLEEYYKLFSNTYVMREYEYGVPFDDISIIRGLIDHWVKNWQENNPYSGYSIFTKIDKKFIGEIGIETTELTKKGVVEIGYIFDKEFWNQGFGFEAASEIIKLIPYLIKYDYRVDSNILTKVIATTSKENIASQKILSKLGFKRNKTLVNRYNTKRYFFSLYTKNILDHCY